MAGRVDPLTTDLGEAEAFTLKYDRKTTIDLYRGGNYEEPKVKELRVYGGQHDQWDFIIDDQGYIILDTNSGKTEIFKCKKGITFLNSFRFL